MRACEILVGVCNLFLVQGVRQALYTTLLALVR